jgi:hypothetical protein
MSYPDDFSTRPVGEGRVVITGVQIPFGDLVVLIIKLVLASIPAYIMLIIFIAMLAGIFRGVLGGLGGQ